jgi:hypothetical protein
MNVCWSSVRIGAVRELVSSVTGKIECSARGTASDAGTGIRENDLLMLYAVGDSGCGRSRCGQEVWLHDGGKKLAGA